MTVRPLLRMRQAFQFTKLQLRNVMDDTAIFVGRWKKGSALRQRSIGTSRMLLRADQDSGRFLYFYGQYEPEECSYFQQALRPADICFDVGANVGFYTLLFSRLAGEGEVHAFEPVESSWHILSTNVLANNLTNVTVNRAAVGACDAELEFTLASDPTYSSFVDTERRTAAARIRVPAMSIDSYIEKSGLPRIDCLKVDVEGAEYKVLTGAAGLLSDAKRRPRIVMLELHDPMLQRQGSSIDQVVQQMAAYGYSPFIWSKQQHLPFRREHYMEYFNVFFVPQ
ncbi:MAG TPA: FkbM family methyltransferase [Verrucomicrobiae bacterium]|nr:FkbM family methyltransferase [Verrucomicrobiae bacterium]